VHSVNAAASVAEVRSRLPQMVATGSAPRWRAQSRASTAAGSRVPARAQPMVSMMALVAAAWAAGAIARVPTTKRAMRSVSETSDASVMPAP